MLRGLTTVNVFADDPAAAHSWYTELLGIEPYFVREIEGEPAYIEFPDRRLPAQARVHRPQVPDEGSSPTQTRVRRRDIDS